MLGSVTVPGKFTSVAGLVAVEAPLLGEIESEPPGRILSNWEKRGGDGSRRVSEVAVGGRGDSGLSRGFAFRGTAGGWTV